MDLTIGELAEQAESARCFGAIANENVADKRSYRVSFDKFEAAAPNGVP